MAFFTFTVPSISVKLACCALLSFVLVAVLVPMRSARFSRLVAAFFVGSGNTTYDAATIKPITNKMAPSTLRYVAVFHPTWILGM